MRTCFLVLMLSMLMVSSNKPVLADPVPIVFNESLDRWEKDNSGTFASSGVTIDIQRFAQIPDNPNGSPARMNHIGFAPGVPGIFLVSAGESANMSSPAPIYHITGNGSVVTEVIDVGSVFTLPRNGSFFTQQGGVRGIAFHPEFNNTMAAGYGKVYTTQIIKRPADPSSFTTPWAK
jgi:hypothetical protein